MPRIAQVGSNSHPGRTDWADPGYFSGTSVVGNTVRILVQLVHPPRGHRTVPTKTGSMLIFLTIGIGTAAFNTGQNILYLALSIMLSTLLVSGILSWLNFKGCRWRLQTGRHFRAGESSPVFLELHNGKKRLPSYDLSFHLFAPLSGQRKALVLEERLDPGKDCRLLWEFKPGQRGREILQLEGMVSRYPFGFLRKTIRGSYQCEVMVWPARLPYQFSADKAGKRWMYGQHRRRGDGVELIHLRGYRSGDPLRRIHWKASARMGVLQVRETEQEHHQAFVLCVDPSPRLWRDKAQFERMCSFAASLAEDLYQRDQLKGFVVAGKTQIRVGGIDDLYQLLDTLAQLEQTAQPLQAGAHQRMDAVTFLPGSDGTVIARMEEQHVGQA